MQISESITIGVVAERRKIDSPWADHAWRPCAVLERAPEIAPGTMIASEDGRAQFYMGQFELTLHRKETESYHYNLGDSQPRIYVSLRHGAGPAGLPVFAHEVTAAPDEAQAWTEVGDDVVDGVPMPESIAAWIADFVSRFHVEEPKHKRKRV